MQIPEINLSAVLWLCSMTLTAEYVQAGHPGPTVPPRPQNYVPSAAAMRLRQQAPPPVPPRPQNYIPWHIRNMNFPPMN